MKELPRGLKIATVWLVLGTLLFLAVQAFLSASRQTSWLIEGSGLVLQRQRDGHFHWPGRVNGRPIEFLVDTGATRTALPGALAERLGLTPEREVQSATAGGIVTGYEARVDLVLEGGIAIQRLRVTVLPDLGAPLLGMDVLGRMRFTQQDGRLTFEGASR
jgi:aspartyl protease family protein